MMLDVFRKEALEQSREAPDGVRAECVMLLHMIQCYAAGFEGGGRAEALPADSRELAVTWAKRMLDLRNRCAHLSGSLIGKAKNHFSFANRRESMAHIAERLPIAVLHFPVGSRPSAPCDLYKQKTFKSESELNKLDGRLTR
ncbi:hypothetical protein [Burkholderia sp. MSMB1498]|uniref:hypothetical protein n=1 Tax=Burkholderia sp. MSMB1498 TaxID=1637842 RepID=UPI001269B713|nr:hypothetical protein [Burkholderia sp. MSMB1498]